MTPVALGLGSNKKFSDFRPEEILGGAIFELSKILHGIEISSVYRTKAMYVLDQEDFYNMALAGFLDDGTSARTLLEKIHEIEAAFGRERENEIRFGPRSLDIDIELFGGQKILEPDLQIPHPRLKERAFVLIPLSEVLDNLENRKAAAQNARQDGDFPHEKNLANAMERSDDAPAAQAACQKISYNATAWNADAQAARAANQIISAHAKPQSGNAQVAQPVNQDESPSIIETQITSYNATAWNADAQAARAASQIISSNATTQCVDAQAARAASHIISTHAKPRSGNAPAAQPVNQDESPSIIETQITSSNAMERSSDAPAARAACQIISTHAKPQSGNAPAAQPVNQDESPSIIETQITSTHAMTRSVDAPAARAASHIISTHATEQSSDNIKGEIFCLCRDEISAALSSLGETDGGVEKIIRAQDFLPFIKSRLQDGRSSR